MEHVVEVLMPNPTHRRYLVPLRLISEQKAFHVLLKKLAYHRKRVNVCITLRFQINQSQTKPDIGCS